jgi:tetratricopeptide (TPR) repeat protein
LNEEPDKAIEALNVVIRLEPDDKKSQERLDNLLAQTGDIDAIIAQREIMIQRFPDDMEKRLELARSYHRIGEFEKTIEQLKIVISKEPENMIALELLGDTYQNMEMFNSAISTYQMLIKINSKDKKNRCNMAMCYISLGKYTLAKRQVARALSVDRQYGLAFLTNGLIYETAADKCVANRSGQKITFDDKLVYKMAYGEYTKAKRDLEWKSDADKRMKYLENMLPTNSDYFMHKNQDMPRSDCYNWIK